MKKNKYDIDDWLSMGSAHEQQQDYEKAIECYDKVIKSDATESLAWRNKGYCLDKLMRLEEALECYHQAICIDEEDISSWMDKAYILSKLGKKEECMQCYDKVLSIDPNHDLAKQLKILSTPRVFIGEEPALFE